MLRCIFISKTSTIYAVFNDGLSLDTQNNFLTLQQIYVRHFFLMPQVYNSFPFPSFQIQRYKYYINVVRVF